MLKSLSLISQCVHDVHTVIDVDIMQKPNLSCMPVELPVMLLVQLFAAKSVK